MRQRNAVLLAEGGRPGFVPQKGLPARARQWLAGGKFPPAYADTSRWFSLTEISAAVDPFQVSACPESKPLW